ncbi:MAG: sulfite exporter TauE/SafE family protein [Pirellulaceae bacterium]|nr:sulfite exporter TauE/SafE family protein [Pirellulaceae bacterium]
MATLLLAVWSASIFGSAHCVGMCGPLAVLAGTHGRHGEMKTSWGQVFAYHLGRLVPYAVLGALFGWLGQMVDIGGSFWGLTRVMAWVAGGMMILAGGISLARQMGFKFPVPPGGQTLGRAVQRGFRAVAQLPPLTKSIAIGGLTSLLPCGWLYVFLLTAAGVADPFWGAVTMVVFWAGTVPLLLGVMLGADKVMRHLPVSLSMLTAILAIGVGVLTLTGRAQAELTRSLPGAQSLSEVREQLDQAVTETPDCCSTKSRDADEN